MHKNKLFLSLVIVGLVGFFIRTGLTRSTIIGSTQDAADIYITDSANHFNSITVEGALAELSVATGTVSNLYLTKSSATATYLTKSSATATYLKPNGDGSQLTGLTPFDHQLDLINLQGGSSGAIVNSNNVPFTNSASYSFNASEITVSGGKAKLKSSGAATSYNWPYTTPANYTYNTSSITVAGGQALLGQTSTYMPSYAHYKLNEVSGTAVSDSSGNGRNGSTIGSWNTGKLNNGLVLTGTQDADLGNIANFERTNTFSLEVWLKTTDTTGAVFHRRDTGGLLAGWDLAMTANTVYFYFANTTVSNMISVYTSFVFADNSWHHYVITYDGSSNANGVNIYIDGSLKSKTIQYNTLTASTLSSANCKLGSSVAGFSSMNGIYDEATIYTSVLTLPQVQERYNSGTGTENTPYLSSIYWTTNPSITTNNGFIFNVALQQFTETAIKPTNTELKYQLSHDNGATYKYWTGALWSTSDGTYAQSSAAADVNSHITALTTSGTLKVKSLLHTSNSAVTPQLSNIEVAAGVTYTTGTFNISMNTDIQPTINNGYQNVVETSSKPLTTDIQYQYSINSGSSYNGSWLSLSSLIAALQVLSPVGDGNDKLRLKFQLETSSAAYTPELDNVLINSDGGTGTTEMYHVSSGTYADLSSPFVQLSALHTNGSPEFATVTATEFLGDGSYLENLGLYKDTKVTVSCIIDDSNGVSKGQAVYFKGTSGGLPTVALADRLGTGNIGYPCGIAAETGNDTDTILVRTQGHITGLDTSAYSPGNILYLDMAGGFTDSAPSSGTVRVVGACTYNHATAGSIYVSLNESKVKAIDKNKDFIIRLGSTTASTKLKVQNFEGVDVSSITDTGSAYFKNLYVSGQAVGTGTTLRLKEDAFTKVLSTGAINFTSFLDVSSIGNVSVDTITLRGELTVIPSYAVVVGTFSGTGIDFNANAISSFTAQVAFQAAISKATTQGRVVFVREGTYVFSSSTTIKTSGMTILTPGATIYMDPAMTKLTTANRYPFSVQAPNCVIDGFTFMGKIVSTSYNYCGITNTTAGTFCVIRNCTFRRLGTGGWDNTSRAIYLNGNYSIVAHCTFVDATGGQTITINGTGQRLMNLLFYASYDAISDAGSGTIIQNVVIYNAARYGFLIQGGDGHTLNGFYISNCVLPMYFGNPSKNIQIANGGISGTTSNHGLSVPTANYTLSNITVNNVIFENIGTVAANTINAIQLTSRCKNVTVSGCHFTGVIDNYAIYISSKTSQDFIIADNHFETMTGNVGIIYNLGISMYSRGNLPVQSNFELLVSSQTATGKPNLIPVFTGTKIMTVDYINWVSTGTANLGDWQKIGDQ